MIGAVELSGKERRRPSTRRVLKPAFCRCNSLFPRPPYDLLISQFNIMPAIPVESQLILLLASWFNVSLFTLEIVLCLRYFQRPARPLIHKIGVGLLVTADTICTAAVLWDVCLFMGVARTTNFLFLSIALLLQVIPTYISAAISQLFLTNLFVMLVGNKLLGAPLVLLILTHCGFSWASAILTLTTFNLGGIVLITSTIGAISCAATDLIIAVCLAWKFWTMVGNTSPEISSGNRLRRILILIVSSGALCAVNTCVAMILILKNSHAYDFFFACQGRVYALTLLGNFLLGAPLRRDEMTTLKLDHINFKTSVDTGSQSIVSRLTESLIPTTAAVRGSRPITAPSNSRSFANYDWIQFDELTPAPSPVPGTGMAPGYPNSESQPDGPV
ncbi:hypothetical protein MVEN_02200100 [Mycena venus]|uniref:DUF6534 domain-containing protein n=1 Tax=Mycena venus TaxID=2733690 RepID=A0A8H6X7C0_9AGAR|nr:hypothetical protein MVEN_02200100 [Mycena venus]